MRYSILFVFLFSSFSLKAQITREYKYDMVGEGYTSDPLIGTWVVDLQAAGPKYLMPGSGSWRLYNENHSLYLDLQIAPNTSIEAENITDQTFDVDGGVEFMFTEYNVGGDQRLVVYNSEDLTEVFSTPFTPASVSGYIRDFGTEKKLIVRYTQNPGIALDSVIVYDLPGTVTSSPRQTEKKLKLKAYPNPTRERVTLEYELTDGSEFGDIILYALDGTPKEVYRVSTDFENLLIDTSGWKPGLYLYRLITDKGTVSSGKLLVE